jgi:hypothetical protein
LPWFSSSFLFSFSKSFIHNHQFEYFIIIIVVSSC